MNTFNVRDFGARGDGVALDSPAIQKAFDQAAAAGGGTVWFPPGIYLAGNLQLRDHLTVHLAGGAVLKAVADLAAYPEDRTVSSAWLRHYLLEGREVRNVIIEGPGVIDGSGPRFWEDHYINANVLAPKAWRPVVLYLVNSRGITVRDVTIRDGAAFTVWLLGCESVVIDGVTIRNPRNGPNTDGLDIDCCRNVRISNCDLEAGDDCIALKSDGARLGRPMPCENIAVTNCHLSSTTCGVRIGYEGDAPIRDCVFSNLTFSNCRHGLDLLSIRPAVTGTTINHGTPIDRLVFTNLTMREVGRAIFLWAGKERPEFTYGGHVRDVLIANLQGQVNDSSYIGAQAPGAMGNLTLRDIRLVQDWHREAQPEVTIPSHWGSGFMPWSLNLCNLDAVRLENVAIRPGVVTEGWSGRLAWDGIADGWLNGTPLPAPDGRWR
jgi:polygalacturonase